MAEGFYAFGLSWAGGYLGATWTQVFMRAGGRDMSLRDITIAQMGNGATECGWRHAREARGGFGDFEKVSELSWVLPRKKTVDFRLLAEALQRVCTRWGGADKKARIERMCISLLMSKNL